MPAPVTLTLIGKPDCHLCEDALVAVERVRARMAERGVETVLEELSILDDEALARRYSEDIPVLRVEGRQHAVWRVDEDRLALAVEKAAGRRRLFGR